MMSWLRQHVLHAVPGHVFFWIIGALVVLATGFTPEHLLADLLSNLPNFSSPLISLSVGVRLFLLVAGISVIAFGIGWRKPLRERWWFWLAMGGSLGVALITVYPAPPIQWCFEGPHPCPIFVPAASSADDVVIQFRGKNTGSVIHKITASIDADDRRHLQLFVKLGDEWLYPSNILGIPRDVDFTIGCWFADHANGHCWGKAMSG
jgi:hypothetical protein